MDKLTVAEYEMYLRYSMQQPLGISAKMERLFSVLLELLHNAHFDSKKYPFKITDYVDWFKYK